MLAFLVANKFTNDLDIPCSPRQAQTQLGLPGESLLERLLHQIHIETLGQVLSGQAVTLRITHKGRIRMAELRQSLTSGKQREPLGILWDGRHFKSDFHLSVLQASKSSPLALAVLDMNGLKTINDDFQSHAAGDIALQTYFQCISAAIDTKGEAYRLGGDEVAVLMPNADSRSAFTLMAGACRLLMGRKLSIGERPLPRISLSAGIVACTNPLDDPDELQKKADSAQYRAKAKTRTGSSRPSAIEVDSTEEGQMIDFGG